MPFTVTSCGEFQFAGVKVNFVTDARASPGSLDDTTIRTFALGLVFRTTLKAAVSPASLVNSPAIGITWNPATSLSVFVTETSAPLIPPYTGSALIAGAVLIV